MRKKEPHDTHSRDEQSIKDRKVRSVTPRMGSQSIDFLSTREREREKERKEVEETRSSRTSNGIPYFNHIFSSRPLNVSDDLKSSPAVASATERDGQMGKRRIKSSYFLLGV